MLFWYPSYVLRPRVEWSDAMPCPNNQSRAILQEKSRSKVDWYVFLIRNDLLFWRRWKIGRIWWLRWWWFINFLWLKRFYSKNSYFINIEQRFSFVHFMLGEGRLVGSRKMEMTKYDWIDWIIYFLRRRRWCRESARDRSVVRKMRMRSKAIPLEMKNALPVRKKKRRQAILIDPFPNKMKMQDLLNKRT